MQSIEYSLYICSTYYHVYITLLKCMVLNNHIDLALCDDIPTGKELSIRCKNSGLFRNVWFVEQSKLPREWGRNLIDWIFFQKKRRYQAITPKLPFQVDDYNQIYIFHDGTPLGMYLIDAQKPYHLIEDSLNFYQHLYETPQGKFLKRNTLKYHLRKLFRLGYFSLGDSPYTLDVEVNENFSLQLPNLPIREQNREFLQKQLNKTQKQQLLSLFDVPSFSAPIEETALVLTEPLFLDHVCASPEIQYSIYEEITNHLSELGYCIMIKPHPRDTLQYEKLNAIVLSRTFPAELLGYLLDGQFQCVAAVSSSAINTVPAKERKQYSHFIE